MVITFVPFANDAGRQPLASKRVVVSDQEGYSQLAVKPAPEGRVKAKLRSDRSIM